MMGEIADMMLNGDMCQWCGEFINGGDGPGYPGLCPACAEDARAEKKTKKKAARNKNHKPKSD